MCYSLNVYLNKSVEFKAVCFFPRHLNQKKQKQILINLPLHVY